MSGVDFMQNCHSRCEIFTSALRYNVGRGTSVGIATCYGLDGLGLNPGGGEIFTPMQTCSGTHSASYAVGTGSFPGVKRPGRGVDYPPLSTAEVKGRLELYITPHLDLRGLFQGERRYNYCVTGNLQKF